MKKLITKFSGVSIAMVLTAISLAAQSSVGYVVEIEGSWILNGSKTLSQGEKLPAGGSIRHQSSSRNDRLTIANMRGNVLESASRNCANENCSAVIILPRRAPSNSWLSALMELIRTAPPRDDLNQSRSGELSDDVVELTDDKIDLSSVMRTPGDKYLRWRPISQNKSGIADWTQPIKMDKTAIVSGFQPGLYEINLVRSNGSNFEPVASAWILVAAPADYENARASLQKVRDLIKTWGDKIKPKTKRLFLQVSLESLRDMTAK